jgi:hypothetical protein
MVRIYKIEPLTSPVRRALDRKAKTPVPSHKRKDTTPTASTRRK